MSSSKDFKQMIKEMKALGWEHKIRRNNHEMLFHEKYGKVFMAATPSDRRAVLNIRSVIKRKMREANG